MFFGGWSDGGFPQALFWEQIAVDLEQLEQGDPTIDTSHRTLRLRHMSHALASRFFDDMPLYMSVRVGWRDRFVANGKRHH